MAPKQVFSLLPTLDTSVWAFSVFVISTKIVCADEFDIIQVFQLHPNILLDLL